MYLCIVSLYGRLLLTVCPVEEKEHVRQMDRQIIL